MLLGSFMLGTFSSLSSLVCNLWCGNVTSDENDDDVAIYCCIYTEKRRQERERYRSRRKKEINFSVTIDMVI